MKTKVQKEVTAIENAADALFASEGFEKTRGGYKYVRNNIALNVRTWIGSRNHTIYVEFNGRSVKKGRDIGYDISELNKLSGRIKRLKRTHNSYADRIAREVENRHAIAAERIKQTKSLLKANKITGVKIEDTSFMRWADVTVIVDDVKLKVDSGLNTKIQIGDTFANIQIHEAIKLVRQLGMKGEPEEV